MESAVSRYNQYKTITFPVNNRPNGAYIVNYDRVSRRMARSPFDDRAGDAPGSGERERKKMALVSVASMQSIAFASGAITCDQTSRIRRFAARASAVATRRGGRLPACAI